jgi:hypothetical protein
MGWTYSREWENKEDVVDYLKDCYNDGIVHSETYEEGQHILWTILCIKDNLADNSKYLIVCDLISPSQYGWGHKTIDEMMGPFYYSCPIHFLNLTEKSEYKNKGWRKNVVEYHNVKLTG